MKRFSTIALSLALALSLGCRRKQEEPPPQPAAPAAQPAPATQPAPAAEQPAPQPPPDTATRPAPSKAAGSSAARTTRAPEPSRPRTAPAQEPEYRAPAAPPPPPRRPVYATISPGTSLEVRLSQALSSGRNKTGDRFEATLDDALESGGRVVVPRGATVVGRITEVESSGRVSGRAKMSLVLEAIRVGGEGHPIQTNTLNLEAQASKGSDAKKIGAGAGIGAIIGAIAGGGKGAAIGAAIGGGAGTAAVVATKGKELELEPEQRMLFRLESDLRVQVEPGDDAGPAAASSSRLQTDVEARIRLKSQRFETAMKSYVARGGDPSRVAPLMEDVQRLLQSGRPAEAEQKLDQALKIVER